MAAPVPPIGNRNAELRSAPAGVAIDAKLKLVGREEVQKLRENAAAQIHLLPPA
jgi:hypothetical protein